MRKLIPVSALFMVISVGGCAPTDVVNTAQVYNPVDSVQEYTQRADTVTLSAGNAQAVNNRIHEIDPWPRNVGNTRIAGNGQLMADAVWQYRCGKAARGSLQATSTGQGGSSSGADTSASGRPGSDCGGGPTAPAGAGR
jgi:hypothetical protein